MNDQEELVLQLEDDALSEPAQTQDLLSRRFSNGWLEGAHNERARDPNLLDGLMEHALFERFDVHSNVRKFGHKFYQEPSFSELLQYHVNSMIDNDSPLCVSPATGEMKEGVLNLKLCFEPFLHRRGKKTSETTGDANFGLSSSKE